MSERKYTHCVVSYASREEIQPLLNACSHWAYILHDKDEADPHFHILARFSAWKSFASVKRYVKSEQNTFTEEQYGDVADIFEYWTHVNFPEKHPYPKEDIVYDSKSYWDKQSDSASVSDSVDQFIDDLVFNDLSEVEMGRKYGRDYIRNEFRYKEWKYKALEDENRRIAKEMKAEIGKYPPPYLNDYIEVYLTHEEWDIIQKLRMEKRKNDTIESNQSNFAEEQQAIYNARS